MTWRDIKTAPRRRVVTAIDHVGDIADVFYSPKRRWRINAPDEPLRHGLEFNAVMWRPLILRGEFRRRV